VIALLKVVPDTGNVLITHDFRRDLHWFVACAELYNGTTNFEDRIVIPDYDLFVEASGVGLGACVGNMVYQLPVDGKRDNIAYWEAINVLFALRSWADMFKHKTIRIYCDNKAATSIFNTSRGSDPTLQAIARNIWLLAVAFDMRLQFEHIAGKNNAVADLLSRWSVVHNPVAKLYSVLFTSHQFGVM
jgi:hypothetical protein